ncbi:hypothetical protein CEP52_006133 [Fusarium oligoseptatum]|uniref:Alb1-domain-containing protein n=1 Tax=Fusarium oligoseptatum TaxID=2604345 RepID=A0A428TUC8_9HYPO|nr:hypothetical protein CEP52_006133 [Fusarium oligoseptatum]
MAKKRGPSIHSRAARRATSPSIDADKSLKRPQHSAGVSKKSKRKTAMSAKARRRHEKGLEMAEAVIERTRSKVEKSKGRGRSIQLRSKAWEEINRVAAEEGVEEDEEVEKRNGGDSAPAAVPLPVDDEDEIL